MIGQETTLLATIPMGAKAEVRVCLIPYRGRVRLDLRTWCDFGSGDAIVRGPTRKGVSIPVSDLPPLLAAVRAAEAHVRGAARLQSAGGAEGL
jgi:hypothetical protein